MNKKAAGIIFVILLFTGLYVSVPGIKNYSDKLILHKGTQVKETKAVSKSSTNKSLTSDEIKAEGIYAPEPEVEKNNTDAEISFKENQSKTVSVNGNQDNSATKTNSESIVTSKNDSNKSSIASNSGSAVSNISSNQVSRGGSTADESKYPLLSKVNGSFGQFRYRDLSGGRIEVDPQWVSQNIVTITLPGLNRQVQVHKDAASHFITAFNYIKNGTAVINGQEVSLLSLIKSMDGTYVTRHVNWNPTRGLSNHSWGTAIDINASGHFSYVDPEKDLDDPNLILWEKAFKPAGFSWGNRYNDSMHYELIK